MKTPKEPSQTINRRKALGGVSFLIAAGLSAGSISTVLSGCDASDKSSAKKPDLPPSFFDAEQLELLSHITETIIPATDTPGAKDAGVHLFLNEFIPDNLIEADQEAILTGLKTIESKAQEVAGKSFGEMTPESRESLLVGILDEGGEQNIARTLIEMTKYGFFTSELGATEVLKHDPIPGGYQGCIDYDEVGKAWSLEWL